MLCKDISIFSYGGHFIQRSGIVYAILAEDIWKTFLCNNFEFGHEIFKDFSLF